MEMNQSDPAGHDPFSCYSPSVELYRYLAVAWGCIVIVVGTVGNLMTVLVFTFKPRMRSRFNMLIVNLAVADLLYCSVVQPASVDSYLHLRGRTGRLWCAVFGLLLFLSNSVSIVTLCLIAVSRYCQIAKRRAFNRVFSTRGLVMLMVSAWVFGLASLAPLLSVFVFVPQVCTCSVHRTEGRPYTTILLFFYFFFGLSCVGIFYLLIYRQIIIASKCLLKNTIIRQFSTRKSTHCTPDPEDCGGEVKVSGSKIPQQAWESQKPSQPTQSSTIAPMHHPPKAAPPPHHDAANRLTAAHRPAPPAVAPCPSSPPCLQFSASDAELKRVTLMCFIVFLCFAFCFAPYLLLNIVDKHNQAPQVLHMFCANLTWLNSCINPVLYAVMNRQFRQAYWSVFTQLAAPFTSIWTWR